MGPRWQQLLLIAAFSVASAHNSQAEPVAEATEEACSADGLIFCEYKGRCLNSVDERCPSIEQAIEDIRAVEEAFEGGDYQLDFVGHDVQASSDDAFSLEFITV